MRKNDDNDDNDDNDNNDDKQDVPGPRLLPGRAGGEGQAHLPGAGAPEHAGRPDSPGGQGQGGEPEAQVREHGPGPVHREPHAGQSSLSSSQSKIKKVFI